MPNSLIKLLLRVNTWKRIMLQFYGLNFCLKILEQSLCYTFQDKLNANSNVQYFEMILGCSVSIKTEQDVDNTNMPSSRMHLNKCSILQVTKLSTKKLETNLKRNDCFQTRHDL